MNGVYKRVANVPQALDEKKQCVGRELHCVQHHKAYHLHIATQAAQWRAWNIQITSVRRAWPLRAPRFQMVYRKWHVSEEDDGTGHVPRGPARPAHAGLVALRTRKAGPRHDSALS